jgi:outer membrane scaffolding protein for murein synthesis (MipA/OmpV family)
MRLVHAAVAVASFTVASAATGARAVDLVADLDVPEHAETTTKAGLVLTFGLGGAYAPDYEGSDDYAAVPLWNLRAGNLYHPDTFVQLLGPTLRSNLLPSEHWRLGVSGRYQPDYDNVDNSSVQDLKDPEAAGLLGLTVGYDFMAERAQDLAVELDAQYDVLEGNGGILTPRLRWQARMSQQIAMGAAISATWGSEDYMGNRFSINSGGSARSGLDEYDADSGVKNAMVTGTASYRLTEAWSLTGIVGYSRLFSEASDSPIVDDEGDENQFLGGLLVNYSF